VVVGVAESAFVVVRGARFVAADADFQPPRRRARQKRWSSNFSSNRPSASWRFDPSSNPEQSAEAWSPLTVSEFFSDG